MEFSPLCCIQLMQSTGSAPGSSAWFELFIFLFSIELPKDPGNYSLFSEE